MQKGPELLPSEEQQQIQQGITGYNEGFEAATQKFRNIIILMFLCNLSLIFISRLLKQEAEIPGIGKIEWNLPIKEKYVRSIENIVFTIQFSLNSILLTSMIVPTYKVLQ